MCVILVCYSSPRNRERMKYIYLKLVPGCLSTSSPSIHAHTPHYRRQTMSSLQLLYINETIPAYEVQLQEEADCNEAIWCKLVTGHTTVTIGVVYRCPSITKQNNEKIYNAISEVK